REALGAAALGGVEAGFRLLSARLGDGDDEAMGSVELLPPGAVPPPPPRTRANITLDPLPGGAGDPDVVPGVGLFGAAERIDRRPYSAAAVARTVADVAVDCLKARGEPATADRLLGEILVGLDRAGQLRRMVAERGLSVVPVEDEPADRDRSAPSGPAAEPDDDGAALDDLLGGPSPVRTRRAVRAVDTPTDPVEALLALIDDGLAGAGRNRLQEIAPDRWWLAAGPDRQTATRPLD